MGRKNANAVRGNRRSRKLRVAIGTMFTYSTDDAGSDATLVRYLGEQDGDTLLCWHPEGFNLWCHLSHLSRSISARSA